MSFNGVNLGENKEEIVEYVQELHAYPEVADAADELVSESIEELRT